MKPDLRPLAIVTQVGVSMVVCILGGLALGLWLDSALNTKPLFTLVFILIGVAAGTYSVYRIVMQILGDTSAPPSHRKGDSPKGHAEKDGEE
jgi:ATP synthase protein I